MLVWPVGFTTFDARIHHGHNSTLCAVVSSFGVLNFQHNICRNISRKIGGGKSEILGFALPAGSTSFITIPHSKELTNQLNFFHTCLLSYCLMRFVVWSWHILLIPCTVWSFFLYTFDIFATELLLRIVFVGLFLYSAFPFVVGVHRLLWLLDFWIMCKIF